MNDYWKAWLDVWVGRMRDERGFSLSTENLLWIIGIIAIAGIAISVISGYVNDQLAKIR